MLPTHYRLPSRQSVSLEVSQAPSRLVSHPSNIAAPFDADSTLANTGGVVNDLFDVQESGYATAMFAFASVAGPPLGNVISGFLAEAAGWRWLFWFYVSGSLY